MNKLKISGHWVGDAQGRKHLHVPLVSITAQFHPLAADSQGPADGKGGSIRCELLVRHRVEEGAPRNFVVDELVVHGAFLATRPDVEAWAQERMDRVVAAIAHEFDVPVSAFGR